MSRDGEAAAASAVSAGDSREHLTFTAIPALGIRERGL